MIRMNRKMEFARISFFFFSFILTYYEVFKFRVTLNVPPRREPPLFSVARHIPGVA